MRPLLRVLCLLLAFAAPASGQGADDARRLFDEGQRLYDAGKYDEAVARWSEGYELSEAPAFLYNIAQAHRLAGRCEEARAFYRRFRDSAGDEGPSGKEAVDRRIEEMDRCVAEREEEERQRAAEAEAEAAAAADDAAAPAPEKPFSPPPPDPGSDTLRYVGIGLGAAAVLLGGASLYYGLDARDASATIEDRWRSGAPWDAEAMAIEERGETAERRAVWLGVGAGAFVATGVVLYWLGTGDGEVAVSPTGVAWSGRF